MPDRISAFVEAVGAEIRWKKARPLLTEEIRTHLLDQRDACVAQGMAEDEAQAEAVRQMGDPVALGADLDRVHRPRPQWGLLALALMLAAAGAFLRFSLTADVPYVSLQDRQMDLLGGLMGAAALAAGYLLDVSALGRRAWWTCAALMAVFLCFLPWRVNGPAWLSAQLLSLFALTLALVLWKQRGRRWRGAAVCLSWTALAAAACCLCPSVYALVQVTMAASLSLTLGAPVLSGGFPLVVGNVNTVVDMLLIGLALSALRDGGLPETAPALCRNRSAAFRRVRWENGELIFSLRPRQG